MFILIQQENVKARIKFILRMFTSPYHHAKRAHRQSKITVSFGKNISNEFIGSKKNVIERRKVLIRSLV